MIFDGKVAIVTGGTRGIGGAITTMLAANGASVAAGYSRDKETAERLQQQVAANGGRVSLHQGRVDDPDDCARVVAEVLERYGHIDFLINNAGITLDKTVRRMTNDDWHNVLNVNLFGSFAMIKACIEPMIERGAGRIVNISSVIGETGNVGQANYAASKAGLFGLSKSLALGRCRNAASRSTALPRASSRPRWWERFLESGVTKDRREDPAAPARQDRRSRARRVLPAGRCFELHHGSRLYRSTARLDMWITPTRRRAAIRLQRDGARSDPDWAKRSNGAVLKDALTDHPLRHDDVDVDRFDRSANRGHESASAGSPRRAATSSPSAATSDKRFSDAGWKRNPFLLGMAESYLEIGRAAMTLVEGSRLPEPTRRKAKFALQMLTDALSPSNVPWMNPAVVREAMETGGTSLVRGLQTFMADAQNNGGLPRQVDNEGFKLGVNIAATPGRVVFRNELIELIAYEPQTATVHEIPLLCSPPWINKYYVMDLAPGRSFVEWAVRHGHQTFAISYRNPDATMAQLGMDDYLRLGLVAALGAVERITGRKRTNLAALWPGRYAGA